MRVDSHHHLWRYDPADYAWIGPHMQVLQRDYLPADLLPLLAETPIDATVAVQAQQTIEETRWLLACARENPAIKGVVGWVPLIDPQVDAMLDEIAADPLLKGVRHVLQDEADDRYMLRDDFNRGVARLKDRGLTYDVLIFGRHLAHAATFVDRHPDQVFVLDHIAKPTIRGTEMDRDWQIGMRELAKRPNVFCKLSGVVTEVRDADVHDAVMAPYMTVALETFGPERLMFGTDWPVCLLRCSYREWVGAVERFVGALSPAERQAIMGDNAVRAYGLA